MRALVSTAANEGRNGHGRTVTPTEHRADPTLPQRLAATAGPDTTTPQRCQVRPRHGPRTTGLRTVGPPLSRHPARFRIRNSPTPSAARNSRSRPRHPRPRKIRGRNLRPDRHLCTPVSFRVHRFVTPHDVITVERTPSMHPTPDLTFRPFDVSPSSIPPIPPCLRAFVPPTLPRGVSTLPPPRSPDPLLPRSLDPPIPSSLDPSIPRSPDPSLPRSLTFVPPPLRPSVAPATRIFNIPCCPLPVAHCLLPVAFFCSNQTQNRPWRYQKRRLC